MDAVANDDDDVDAGKEDVVELLLPLEMDELETGNRGRSVVFLVTSSVR